MKSIIVSIIAAAGLMAAGSVLAASDNPFANLKYTGAENLETDPDKLNYHKGTIEAAGGFLKRLEAIDEENKNRDLTIKLQNAERELMILRQQGR